MIVLELPLPAGILNPNARPHWAAKNRATQAERSAARLLARSALRKHSGATTPYSSARMTVDLYFPDNKARDCMNIAGALKGACDGIVDAGVITDDRWQVLEIGHVRGHLDRDNPRVVLTVESMTTENPYNEKTCDDCGQPLRLHAELGCEA